MNNLLSRTAVILGLFLSAQYSRAQDIIIESGQGGQNVDHYKELKGDWTNNANSETEKSHAPGLAPGGGSRKLVPQNAAGEARFMPRFSQAGHYFVYVTWPKAANAKQVVYIAKHSSGQGSRAAIQNGTAYHNPGNADKWVYLGEYDFGTGDDQYISVMADPTITTANDPKQPGMLFADAIRFTQKPLTPQDGAELFPRDRVELRALPPDGVPAGAAPLLAATPSRPNQGGGQVARKNVAPAPTQSLSELTPTPALAPAPMETKPPLTAALTNVAGLAWGNDLGEALKAAANQPRKRILVYFHSAESILCARYDNEIFTNPQISNLLQNQYILVKLEIDQNSAVAAKLGVFRSGVVLLYDNAGNGLKKIEYAQNADGFAKEIQF